jgi:hypothetical protein
MVADGNTSPVHKASLVDAALHHPGLLELLDIEVSRPVIEYVVDTVVDTVDYAMGRPTSSARGRSLSRNKEHSTFTTFVTNVIERAEVSISVILTALVYIDRAKPHLEIAHEEWACERVFLGAIILASKYLNDSTLKNVHWAISTGVFGKRDVGRIERELLSVLDFELGIVEADLMGHHDGLSAVALEKPSRRHRDSSLRRANAVSHHHHHSHPRNLYDESLPSLEHSSPSASSSSSGSSSPRTPDTLVSTPPESDPKSKYSVGPIASMPARQTQWDIPRPKLQRHSMYHHPAQAIQIQIQA